ncbi:histidine kinase dimerization/phospho-acceptor domain-containing protein [Vibrio sp. kj40-1]|uniref:histidine kinase n=1 Tax=Vibrio algarum TaxID=3020714 RepID=A0ABT4YX67_9VIBR|nr:histidine kinase dimerization/phospho-acceptor domain-containing protein [Vibrio sp. KJ40-1]MDB1126187.1 histidine kinase dimerization/phospho-acceptor domain-containing protein [Vibrio sp. KJ40-1]
MLLASASIGRKLLLSFASMAGLLILAVVIGTSGFSFVAETEKQVIDSSVPAMIQAREVSEQSSRILSSLGVLSNAKTEKERQQAGLLLFAQLEKLLEKIKQLGDKPFDVAILERLENRVQDVIDTIVELGVVVEEKIFLEHAIILQVEEMRQLAAELETLTRTQVLNTSTIAVANVTNIYNLIKEQDKESVYQALDNLIEVDLDLSERLHELHLLAFQMLAHIEEAKTLTNSTRIQQLRVEFDHNVEIIKRRIQSVEDPTRSRQMQALVNELELKKEVFDYLEQRYDNSENAESLKALNLTQLSELNKTVSLLVDESNSDTALAIEDLSETLNYAKWSLIVLSLFGLVAVSFILWNVVYLSVVKKLHIYSDAIRSVAKGELDFDIDVKGSDELAQMGKAIVTARDTAEKLQTVAASEALAKTELEDHKAHLEQTITERTKQLRTTNDKLNQEVSKHNLARLEAEQANRAKTAFLSTMSHEIRTPMNGVLGTATLLGETPLNSKQEQYVDVINRSGTALLGILNDVLDYSKIEAGFLEIRKEAFNLFELVTDAYQLQRSNALEKNSIFPCMLIRKLGVTGLATRRE